MTVLAVERKDTHIYVASDSRCSWKGVSVDYCTKIFKLDLKVRTTIGFEKKTTVGFAFAGGVDFFFDVKNRLEFVLANILVDYNEVNLDEIVCDLIAKGCQDVANAYKASFKSSGTNIAGNTDILFFMKSLVNNGTGTTDFVYKDFWIDSNYSVLPVNKPGDYQFFGSGERVARQLKNDPQYEWKNIVRFVQDVVKKMPSNSSVGGNVQVGVLEDSGFRVLGYQDLNEQGEFVYYYGSAAIPEYENFQPLDASFLCIYDEAEVKKKQEEFLKKVMDDLGADDAGKDSL